MHVTQDSSCKGSLIYLKRTLAVGFAMTQNRCVVNTPRAFVTQQQHTQLSYVWLALVGSHLTQLLE